MTNAHLQLFKDIQSALGKCQAMAFHNEYYEFAQQLEGIMVRIGNVILAENDLHKPHTCTCSSSGDQ